MEFHISRASRNVGIVGSICSQGKIPAHRMAGGSNCGISVSYAILHDWLPAIGPVHMPLTTASHEEGNQVKLSPSLYVPASFSTFLPVSQLLKTCEQGQQKWWQFGGVYASTWP